MSKSDCRHIDIVKSPIELLEDFFIAYLRKKDIKSYNKHLPELIQQLTAYFDKVGFEKAIKYVPSNNSIDGAFNGKGCPIYSEGDTCLDVVRQQLADAFHQQEK